MSKVKKSKVKKFIIGFEDGDLESGMIIEAKDLNEAREIINENIDIHEVDNKGEFID